MEKTSGNRWLVAVGTIIAQIGLGTIYTWSLFNQPLANKFETNISDVSITFSIMSLALAVAAMFGDALEKKLGIRKLTTFKRRPYRHGLCTNFKLSLCLSWCPRWCR